VNAKALSNYIRDLPGLNLFNFTPGAAPAESWLDRLADGGA
jgi:hypothetical protein